MWSPTSPITISGDDSGGNESAATNTANSARDTFNIYANPLSPELMSEMPNGAATAMDCSDEPPATNSIRPEPSVRRPPTLA